MIRSRDREVLPAILCPEDPHAGDEVLYDPGSWENAVRLGVELTREEHDRLDLEFHGLYLDVLCGRRPWDDPSLSRVSGLLGLDRPRKHDTRPPRVASLAVADEYLADVVEDFVPDFRLSVERITADPERVDVSIVSALCFCGIGIEGRSPLELWGEEKLDRPQFLAARVIEAAPPCLYRDGAPLLPLSHRWAPPGGPPGTYVGRAYRVGDGWAWSGCVGTGDASPDAVLRRLDLELMRYRRHERRASFEDLLRERPEVVYRSASETGVE